MNKLDFTTSMEVDATSERVFNAVNNVRAWWSANIEGKTDELNEVFFYHNKDAHLCKLEIVEMVPNKQVTWLVTDNYFSFTKNKSEWKDTKISFDISKIGNKSKLDFTHYGLTPDYECYEICDGAWTMFILESLQELIITGHGKPLPRLEKGYDTEFVNKWKKEN